jgi:hypothetical protein
MPSIPENCFSAAPRAQSRLRFSVYRHKMLTDVAMRVLIPQEVEKPEFAGRKPETGLRLPASNDGE